MCSGSLRCFLDPQKRLGIGTVTIRPFYVGDEIYVKTLPSRFGSLLTPEDFVYFRSLTRWQQDVLPQSRVSSFLTFYDELGHYSDHIAIVQGSWRLWLKRLSIIFTSALVTNGDVQLIAVWTHAAVLSLQFFFPAV